MRFDDQNGGWAPAHDREVRLHSSLGLVVGLALMAISAGALFMLPKNQSQPRHAVAAAIP
ncbi:MAG TPA: hypothetical protein VFE90_11120 [Myxococcales bacterium]|jgi:hypothetical protein|nr:hypothetical protein [Myxococcales bacterium]